MCYITIGRPSALLADFCRATLRTTNRLYRRMRIGAARRTLSRNHGERFLAPGYACAPRAEWLCRYRDVVLPKGAHFWYKGDDGSVSYTHLTLPTILRV